LKRKKRTLRRYETKEGETISRGGKKTFFCGGGGVDNGTAERGEERPENETTLRFIRDQSPLKAARWGVVFEHPA